MREHEKAAGIAVAAADFGLKGPRGWAFRDVGFDAEPGSLIALAGPSGSGRTSLLLALTGRMKPSEGRATVGGHLLPKDMSAVRRLSALAHVPGVTDLDPALTVGEHLRERALLESRFGDSLRALPRPRADRVAQAGRRIDTALASARLDLAALPKGSRTAVRDLERLEALRLSVALALIGRPRLLAVDDADLKLADAERSTAWALLRSLTEAGITVLAVCAEAPEGAVVISTAPEAGGRPDGGDKHSPEGSRSGHGERPPADRRSSDDERSQRPDEGEDPARTAPEERQTHRQPDARPQTTPDKPSEDGGDDDKETADALAETGRA
ncbi:ATP-binding cassette domain-containing protein [Streptomyces sp. CA-106110]|uniref:ATP-binding cassette domain-containing protein n=1 Tax=Streptomyces sp. CA-106110 TaxID=3240044 RepID=UPI003D923EA4